MFVEPLPNPPSGARRVLGVDPGLTRCGVGVVDVLPGSRLRLAGVAVIRTDAGAGLAERLLTLEAGLTAWCASARPAAVAVERVFAQHNVRTVMGTAQAAAVAALVAGRAGVPLALHTPSEVKAAVTGSGRADKAQVGTMVARLLGLREAPRPADAADVLSLAICHGWRAPIAARAEAASARSAPARPDDRAVASAGAAR